jgi:hypothetical protein
MEEAGACGPWVLSDVSNTPHYLPQMPSPSPQLPYMVTMVHIFSPIASESLDAGSLLDHFLLSPGMEISKDVPSPVNP